MKTFWKVLGFAALAAGLTPYKVEKDEETGEKNYQALLWAGSSKSDKMGKKHDITIYPDAGALTARIMDAVDRKKEAHLFSDELSVEYTGGGSDGLDGAEEPAEEPAEEAAKEAAEAAAEAREAAEEAREAAASAKEAAEEAAPKAEE